mmetsp:Transcript_143726/g.261464  ORF Transcript_143726/g.261464 Transcript_143726/m.261464 type:complete len:366 (+) Transcript_143726:105-1202(+)
MQVEMGSYLLLITCCFFLDVACAAQLHSKLARRETSKRRFDADKTEQSFAYATMIHDFFDDHQYADSAIALAASLRAVASPYPLLVMMNASAFGSSADVAAALHKLNIQMISLPRVALPKAYVKRHPHAWGGKWNMAWNKISMWNLTQYDKILWLDADAIVTHNIDWLFSRKGLWAMNERNYITCKRDPGEANMGFLLMQPSAEIYQDMLRYADGLENIHEAETTIVNEYLKNVARIPIGMLPSYVADYGHCALGPHFLDGCEGCARLPKPISSLQAASQQIVPHFIHKGNSKGYNCFSRRGFNRSRCAEPGYAVYRDYWHENFCAGVLITGLRSLDAAAFCKGMPSILPDPLPAPAAGDPDMWQ